MGRTASIGSRIYIGDPSWTHETLAEYDGQTTGWEEIGRVESVPEHGTKWETGAFTPVATGLKEKFKTVQDAGDMQLVCARDGSDAGQQAAMDAAEDEQADYPFMVTLGDKPAGAGAKPTRSYFRALVTSATLVPGGASDVVKTNIGVAVNSKVIIGQAST